MTITRLFRCRRVLFIGVCALIHVGAWSAPAPSFADGDAALASLLASVDARLELMPRIAAIKWQEHLPIRDARREAAVLKQAGAAAREFGLLPGAVENLFALQLRLAREAQQQQFDVWRRDGFSGSSAAGRSLSRDLRPKLDAMTRDQLRGLYVWVATTSANGGRQATLASLEQLLPAPRWSRATRSQLLSAIQAVRIASEGSLARARHAGILRIATTADYAPFSEEINGALSGVDIELALGLAASLRLQPQFVRTTWRDLLHDLHAGRFDVAVGGISVTPERAAQAAYSTALFKGGKTAIGRCADAGRYASFDAIDQPGVRVVYNTGGTNEAFVRRSVHRAVVRGVDDNRITFDEILHERADVMFTDDTEVELQHTRHPELCRLLQDTFMPTAKAFLMPRDPELQRTVSHWVAAQVDAHEPEKLLDRYLSNTTH